MSQVRYTIGTISSNRTQFNTAIIWLIRVQLSVILPRFDLSLSAKKAEMCFNTMIIFTLVISQPNINCQMIFHSNLLTNTTKTSKLRKCIWKYHFIRTSKTLHIVQVTFQRWCAALLKKKDEITLQFEVNCTYVPFKPRHFYIMYCGNDDSEPVTYFQNEQSMWSFLANVIGTHLGKFLIILFQDLLFLTWHQIFEVEVFKSSFQMNHMSWFSVF